MKHGSLFSGIGGFDLASEWMGWENIFQVEWDSYCQKVLAKNFPNVERYGDIKEFDGTQYRGTVDILSGGFPCQPFSHAGKRKGESDDRYLWPEYLRVIREIQPTYVVGENVAGLLSMEDGKTLDGILSDLEGEGYETEQFVIPACGVGAWHRRDRIWIVGYLSERINGNSPRANPNGIGSHRSEIEQQGEAELRDEQICGPKGLGKEISNRINAYNDGKFRGTNKRESVPRTNRRNNIAGVCEDVSDTDNKRLTTAQSEQAKQDRGWGGWCGDSIKGGGEETGGYWSTEPNVGRVANGIPKRVDRLKGLGNAIVPQVAFEIFKAINDTTYQHKP